MRRRTFALVLPLALVVLGGALLVACDEDVAADRDRARQETERVLSELRSELDRGITPERKEQLVKRCADALERLRKNSDADADRLANFCDSLEETTPDTPGGWDDIRNRLNELIRRFER